MKEKSRKKRVTLKETLEQKLKNVIEGLDVDGQIKISNIILQLWEREMDYYLKRTFDVAYCKVKKDTKMTFIREKEYITRIK